MIVWKTGDIFTTECNTIVNTVNCEGVMGKGIALECKARYPFMFKVYQYACKYSKGGNNAVLKEGGDLYFWYNPKTFPDPGWDLFMGEFDKLHNGIISENENSTITGKEYMMFLADFSNIVELLVEGKLTGTFTFCKRGANYGVKYVKKC